MTEQIDLPDLMVKLFNLLSLVRTLKQKSNKKNNKRIYHAENGQQ